jgi:hypothetical protein
MKASKIRNVLTVPEADEIGRICGHVFRVMFETLVRMDKGDKRELVNFLYFYRVLGL